MNKLPEHAMKAAFYALSIARKDLEMAAKFYDERNDETKADKLNAQNVRNAINLLAQVYDEISAIKENDLE